ncbi:hypothetical protein TNCV_2680341 [Trichonephila clavipes]|uniref:Uncharacterized protein n=1 Tax=Trichonephila clavipes TaxID=2585209 RepID=A0A8X6S7T5_TRICX|nr:hypothetical protein TNCV_2680341 [Trichonephila clavipes]
MSKLREPQRNKLMGGRVSIDIRLDPENHFFIPTKTHKRCWRHNAIPATSVCLSPVTRFWIKGVSSEIEKKELSKDPEEKIQLTAL